MEPRATWSHATPARGPAVVLGLRQLARSALVQRSLDTRDHHARPRRVEARPSRRPADARQLAIMGGHPAWRISRADPQDPRAWQPAAAARVPAAHTAARAPPPHTTHQRSSGARCPGRRAAHASGGGGLRAEPHQAGGSRGTSRSAGCWARVALAAGRVWPWRQRVARRGGSGRPAAIRTRRHARAGAPGGAPSWRAGSGGRTLGQSHMSWRRRVR